MTELEQQFSVEQVEVGGIDFSVWKIYLKGLYKCNDESKYYQDINVTFKNISEGTLVNEVKKVGVIIDRG